MRFNIDLLKGKGLPQKTHPLLTAAAAMPFIIPVLVTILTAASWHFKENLMETESRILEENKKQTQRLEKDMREYQRLQTSILGARHEIRNVEEALQMEMPATPILLELVEALPSKIIINKLELNYTPVRRKQIDPKTNQATYGRVVERTLRIVVAGPNNLDSDKASDEYLQKLRRGKVLSAITKEMGIISRHEAEIDGKQMILYEIQCKLLEQKH
jgi:hypothetical protein